MCLQDGGDGARAGNEVAGDTQREQLRRGGETGETQETRIEDFNLHLPLAGVPVWCLRTSTNSCSPPMGRASLARPRPL